jgi:exodeoxyribonuclease VII large subunit
MWRNEARRLPTDPDEGMEVCVYGRVSIYEAGGRYQLVAESLEARGEGLWRLAFERTRRRLEAEGLTDPARRRSLPAIPGRVGVVTSPGGAALRDVVSVIRRRAPWTHIMVCASRVQGDGAAREIVAALETLGHHPGIDVLVLTRGGGSVEDLWCFNEEEVARAVAACPVPVVTAVGHEVDVTMVDLVADRRAPTPSVAGEIVVPDGEELRAGVRRLSASLSSGLRGRARRAEDRVSRVSGQAKDAILGLLGRRTVRLQHVGARLELLSPLATLERGYAIALDGSGRVLRRLEMFAPEDRFRLTLVDGEVHARVERIKAADQGSEGATR